MRWYLAAAARGGRRTGRRTGGLAAQPRPGAGPAAGSSSAPGTTRRWWCCTPACWSAAWSRRLGTGRSCPALGWPMLALVLAAQGLRWWCIATLGRQWNTRVVVVPGAGRVAGGPYRWLRASELPGGGCRGPALPLVHTGVADRAGVHGAERRAAHASGSGWRTGRWPASAAGDRRDRRAGGRRRADRTGQRAVLPAGRVERPGAGAAGRADRQGLRRGADAGRGARAGRVGRAGRPAGTSPASVTWTRGTRSTRWFRHGVARGVRRTVAARGAVFGGAGGGHRRRAVPGGRDRPGRGVGVGRRCARPLPGRRGRPALADPTPARACSGRAGGRRAGASGSISPLRRGPIWSRCTGEPGRRHT